MPKVEIIEDEYFFTIDHEMTRTHYISLLLYIAGPVSRKLYPNGMRMTRINGGKRFIIIATELDCFITIALERESKASKFFE